MTVKPPVTLAERLAEVPPHDPDSDDVHYSAVSWVVDGYEGRTFYLDLRPVADLLGFDCAIVGWERNAITVRRAGGEPDRDGAVWFTKVYPDPKVWADAVLALAAYERWTDQNPIFPPRTH